MSEKNWSEMGGWETAWEVTQVVVGIGMIVLGIAAALMGGGAGGSGGGRSGSSGGGSVWTVGHGGSKGYGSWGSTRHR